MALSESFNRPKLATTLATTIPLVANVFEVNGTFVIDVTATETNDASATVTKLIYRHIITPTVVGTNIVFNHNSYVFNGSETNWITGGSTPATIAGTIGTTQNLDQFLTNLGIANKNS